MRLWWIPWSLQKEPAILFTGNLFPGICGSSEKSHCILNCKSVVGTYFVYPESCVLHIWQRAEFCMYPMYAVKPFISSAVELGVLNCTVHPKRRWQGVKDLRDKDWLSKSKLLTAFQLYYHFWGIIISLDYGSGQQKPNYMLPSAIAAAGTEMLQTPEDLVPSTIFARGHLSEPKEVTASRGWVEIFERASTVEERRQQYLSA